MLVDSSVWIFAAKSGTSESKLLKSLLQDQTQEVHTCKIVQLEVSQGARTRDQFSVLWEGFQSLKMLQIQDVHWQMSALNFFKCKKKGLSISTVDCLLATLAQQYHVPLWSLDKVFMKMAPILGVEVVRNV